MLKIATTGTLVSVFFKKLGKFLTGFACDSRMVDVGFLLTKRQYIVAAGRVQGRYENYSI